MINTKLEQLVGVQDIFERPVIEKPLAVIKLQNLRTQTGIYYQITAGWTIVMEAKQNKERRFVLKLLQITVIYSSRNHLSERRKGKGWYESISQLMSFLLTSTSAGV